MATNIFFRDRVFILGNKGNIEHDTIITLMIGTIIFFNNNIIRYDYLQGGVTYCVTKLM